MNTTYETLRDGPETDCYTEIEALIKKNPWAWQSVCAVLGLTCGVLAPMLGAVSDITTWVVSSKKMTAYLHLISIVLCALTIPLLILGAFCLDLLETKTVRLLKANAGRGAPRGHA